ncbi:MAG: 4Fe-4S ferredoxin [Deltaproteobacteria bacterium]|nr:MAG: 4Fe-4S ferredoxin [Deltaproteobacteria bacterium]
MSEYTGCPGSRSFTMKEAGEGEEKAFRSPSRLTHWPIQLHLISPDAPQYRDADVLLAADCVAYAMGSFHEDYLKGRTLAIACPKLDGNQDAYVAKIRSWFETNSIKSLTVLIMQVPCCRGLIGLTALAMKDTDTKVPVRYAVVGFRGEIIDEGEVSLEDLIW